jgi:hypothetical protein
MASSPPKRINLDPHEGYFFKITSFKDSGSAKHTYYCKRRSKVKCYAKGTIPFGSTDASDFTLRKEHSPQCTEIMAKKREVQDKKRRAAQYESLLKAVLQELRRRIESNVSTLLTQ